MGYREGALIAVATTPEEGSLTATKPPKVIKPRPSPPKPQVGFSVFGWVLMGGLPILIVGGVILLLGHKRDS